MKAIVIKALQDAVSKCRIVVHADEIRLDYPEDPKHGDFSSNVAMVFAKSSGTSPVILAEKIIDELNRVKPEIIESISVAGPGFINIKIRDAVFVKEIVAIAGGGTKYGWSNSGLDKKVMIEYTDPNPFKVFHIGHLMSNAIGESISRLVESSGSRVVRACYQGDVGLHVAKTIWAISEETEDWKSEIGEKGITEKVKWLGEMYVKGSQFDDDESIQKEIALINKKIFEKSDTDINEIYEQGRKWSLEYFDTIYARLGTKFDQFFFESEVADDGVRVVREFLKRGIFAESEGAVVFKGDDHGLHTRVFITSQGLPTYEAKELGLNAYKFSKYPDLTESVIITASEQSDYFKVLLKALSLIDHNIFTKTKHISHGMLRFASGKMSSRKGNIISAESLLSEIKALVIDKIADRDFDATEKDEISDMIAIGAIKYTILRQSIGGDVIFDSASSISFEGDSGPYLQYSAVRAGAVLAKGKMKIKDDEKIQDPDIKAEIQILPDEVTLLEKLISRFPDIVERARAEYAPQHIANYLMTLAGEFNSYYANNQIISDTDPLSPYRLALTQAFLTTMTNGLWLLGIKVPGRM